MNNSQVAQNRSSLTNFSVFCFDYKVSLSKKEEVIDCFSFPIARLCTAQYVTLSVKVKRAKFKKL